MSAPSTLAHFGWDERWAAAYAALGPALPPDALPGRVVCDLGVAADVWTQSGVMLAASTGRYQHEHASRDDRPAVGDWVAVSRRPEDPTKGDIHAVLPRRSRFVRRAAGERLVGQTLAANLDTVFLVTGLDGNFNLRRIERTLAVAHASGARPVILLNKADLHGDPRHAARLAASIAGGVPVLLVSARARRTVRTAPWQTARVALKPWLAPAATIAFIGSSGVGKSTLANALAGDDLLDVQETRAADDKGRHTTVRRELVPTPSGTLVIDTPGLREIGLWGAGELVDAVFPEIAALAAGCRFRDCRHDSEPDCAVRAAVGTDALPAARFASYVRLRSDDVSTALRRPSDDDARASRRVRKLREGFRGERGDED